MHINQKIQRLGLACVVIVGGLSIIQYYLIQNTYKLERERYNDKLDEVAKNIRAFPEMDSIENNGLKIWMNVATLYFNDSLPQNELVNRYYTLFDSINKPYLATLNPKIKEVLKPLNAAHKFQYEKIVISNGTNKVVELITQNIKPVMLIGDDFDEKQAMKTGVSHSNSINTDLKGKAKSVYSIDLYYNQYMDVSAFEWQVWKRIWGVFSLAVSLILAVIVLFFLIFRSLWKQKKIAEVQTDFTNNITHELKTPLASLGLIVKSLNKKEIYENPEKLSQMLQSLQRQNHRIQYIVDSVLESATIEKTDLDCKEVEIRSFLVQYFQDFHPQQHLLEVDIAETNQMLTTDLDKLANVLSNLLDNALKYSAATTAIKIKAYSRNKFYCIEIQDNGIGISSENKHKIFDKFYRVSEGDKHAIKGLGLGLYLSKQYIQQLGGRIDLESQFGKGSTFIISLPI